MRNISTSSLCVSECVLSKLICGLFMTESSRPRHGSNIARQNSCNLRSSPSLRTGWRSRWSQTKENTAEHRSTTQVLDVGTVVHGNHFVCFSDEDGRNHVGVLLKSKYNAKYISTIRFGETTRTYLERVNSETVVPEGEHIGFQNFR